MITAKLALEVEHGGDVGQDDLAVMARLGVGEAGEDRRVADHGAAGLLAVHLVVETDAEDLGGVADDRERR